MTGPPSRALRQAETVVGSRNIIVVTMTGALSRTLRQEKLYTVSWFSA
jgi:hypothetical protein